MGVAVLIILVFPIAIVFAILGRHIPAQAVSRTSSVWRLVRGLRSHRLVVFIGHSRGFACRATIAAGFGQAMFGWHSWQLLLANSVRWRWCGISVLAVLVPVLSTNSYCRTYRRADCRYLVGGDIKPANIPFPAPGNIELTGYLLRYQ